MGADHVPRHLDLGHTPVGEDVVHKLAMFRHAVTSLAHAEATVPQARHPEALPVSVH